MQSKPAYIILLLAANVLLVAAKPFVVTPSRNQVLEVPDDHAGGTEVVITQGEIFHRKAVGQALQAVLNNDLRLAVGSEDIALSAGTALSPVRELSGSAAGSLANTQVFCAEISPGSAHDAAPVGGLTALLIGRRIPAVRRLCMVDSNRDGLMEKAFVVGAKVMEAQSLRDIPPVPVTFAHNLPLPGESEMRLRFAGRGGLLGNLGFDLEVVEEGKPLTFSNGRTVISADKLPHDVNIMGARFTVLSFDNATRTARIRWIRGFAPTTYGVESVQTTTYIPVYVPR